MTIMTRGVDGRRCHVGGGGVGFKPICKKIMLMNLWLKYGFN